MPWISRWDESGPDWTAYIDERYVASLTECLCQVCGEAVDSDEVLVLLEPGGFGVRTIDSEALLHRRCAALAAATCPHWQRLKARGVLAERLVRVRFADLALEGDLADPAENAFLGVEFDSCTPENL